jgi:hypothetical protein
MKKPRKQPRLRIVLSIVAASLVAGGCAVDGNRFEIVDGGNEDPDGGGGTVDTGVDPDSGVPPILLVVDPTQLEVSESGQLPFYVSLGSAPAGTFTVEIQFPDQDRLTVAPTTLQYDDINFDDPQEVMVTALEDDDVEPGDYQIVVHAVGAVDDVPVTVLVADNDALALELEPSGTLQVGESASGPISVQLTAEPTGDVVVAITSSDTSVATVSDAELTFTAANWDEPQEVTISGVDDVDTLTEPVTIDFVPDAGETAIEPAAVEVSVVDDDVLGIDVSTTNLGTLTEGASAQFDVELTQQPPASVIVQVVSSDGGAIDVIDDSLTFTTGNWNVAQTVHLSALQDLDTADESGLTVTLSAPGTAGIVPRQVSVAVNDNDFQQILAMPGSLPLDEGEQGTIDVSLQFEPDGPVTVNVATLNGAVATTPTSSLTFLPGDYDEPQSITVNAQSDADLDDDSTAIRFTHAPLSLLTEVAVMVNDLDTQTIETSVSSVTLSETAGSPGTFGVKLGHDPGQSVSVAVSSGNTSKATVPAAPLSFNSGNWNDFQFVTVTGVEDADLVNDPVTITLSGAGAPDRTVSATVNDNDTQHVLVSQASVTVTEGQSNTMVGVRLEFQPAGNVTVNLSTNPTGIATVTSTLTFNTSTWDDLQMITISGAQDDNTVQDTTTITAAAPAVGAVSATIGVTVPDNDIPAFVLSQSSQTINENGTGSFTVRLSHIPPATVNASAAAMTAGIYTLTPQSALTFTSANWNTPITVNVTPTVDTDDVDETTLARITATGVTEGQNNITINDTTVVTPLGWSSYLGTNGDLPTGDMYAYRITTPAGAPSILDQFGIVSGQAGPPTNLAKMALYTDNGSGTAPGTLVTASGTFALPNAGANTITVPPTVTLTASTNYWIAVEANPQINIGVSPSVTATQCSKVHNFANGFPASFTSPNCATDAVFNVFIVTYRQ